MDYKIFDFKKDNFLLFWPEGPSLFIITPIIKDILTLTSGNILDKDIILSKLHKKYKNKDILKAVDELKLIKKRGFLKDNYNQGNFKRPQRKGRFVGLELHLSNDCNLSCIYCFAKSGNYGLNLSNKTMKWATSQKAIDWFLEQNKDNKEALSIGFFGGEPLLNIDVLEKTLNHIEKRCDSKKYPFIHKTIFTNGTLFSEKAIKILKRYNCIPFVSLDSSPEIHNKNRPYKDGRPSFRSVINGLEQLRRLAPDLPVVVCPTLGLKDNLNDILKWQKRLKIGRINLRIQHSLFNRQNGKDQQYGSLLKRIRYVLDRLYNISLRKGVAFGYLVGSLFYHLHSGRDIYEGCGAGIDCLTINADGDIFICSMAMGRTGKLGNILTGFDPHWQDKVSKIYEDYYKKVVDCANCWARKLCHGPCVLSPNIASSIRGVNRHCDFVRLLSEFCLKSYASMEFKDVSGLFGLHKDTEDVLKNIYLLYTVRELKNKPLNYIRHITPVLTHISQ